MAYSPISLSGPPQYHVGGVPASGYVLKAYAATTSTLLQMATDAAAGTLVNDIVLNSEGYPAVSGNIVIPHVNANFKLALYPTQAAADANSGAIWNPDNITPTGISADQVASVDTLTALRNYSGASETVILEGAAASGDGSGAIYYKVTGASAGTYTDNGTSIIVPAGGNGSSAWLQVNFNSLNTIHTCSQSTSTDDYTRICRIVFDTQGEYANLVLRVIDSSESTADNDTCEVVISARQNAALNNDPVCTLRVQNLSGAGSISATSFAAYFSTVTASQSIIDIYLTSASGNLDAVYQALTTDNNNSVITFYDEDGTDTEANITGGTFDVTSAEAVISGSYTATGTGFTTSPTATYSWRKINGIVYLDAARINGTSNSTSFTITGMPVDIRPATKTEGMFVTAQDNGSLVVAHLWIDTDGVITLQNTGFTNWTASGAKSFVNSGGWKQTLIYSVD